MIVKYRSEKIYNPKAIINQVRRASKLTMERRLTYIPLTSKASRLLFCIPGIGFLLKKTMNSGKLLILRFQSKELPQRKEKHEILYKM